MRKPHIVVIGSIGVDMSCRLPLMPADGETVFAERFKMTPGGKGSNAAVAARLAGAQTDLVACVGDDLLGEQARAWLVADKVGSEALVTVQAPTGIAIVMVETDGSNRIIVNTGANAWLHAEHVVQALRHLPRPDCVTGCFEIPDDALIAGFEEAHRLGAVAVLNPSPLRTIPDELMANIDWLVVNELEFEGLFGHYPSPTSVGEVARDLAVGVVVTTGAAGAILALGDQVETFSAPRVNVVDTSGAGDAFLGAFSCAIASGLAPAEAVPIGVEAGALCVEHEGVRAPLPALADLARRVNGSEACRSSTHPQE